VPLTGEAVDHAAERADRPMWRPDERTHLPASGAALGDFGSPGLRCAAMPSRFLVFPVGPGQRILDVAVLIAIDRVRPLRWKVRVSERPAFSITRRDAIWTAIVVASTR
jgi:hypothetical protein